MTTASAETPPLQQHCFSRTSGESTINYQILDIGRQLYIWVSIGNAAALDNLVLAVPTKIDPVPSVAALLPGSATSECQAVAQRISLKVKRPVLCSWNVPGGAATLQAVAERELLKELAALNLL